MWRNLLVTGDEPLLLTIRNTYMKRLMVLILMVVLAMPAFVLADNVGGSKGKGKSKTHSDNGKHKGWYKDGHKHASNIGGRKRHSKKKTSAPYASGTMKKPTSTITNGGVAKNTGGATVKPIPTTSQGGVTKGSGTMSNTGGSVKVSTTTSSQGGTTKN